MDFRLGVQRSNDTRLVNSVKGYACLGRSKQATAEKGREHASTAEFSVHLEMDSLR